MYKIEMQQLSWLIYAEIHIIYAIIHDLLRTQFLDERNNGKTLAYLWNYLCLRILPG